MHALIDLTWAHAPLRAFHTDPIMGEGRHEHVWNVTAYFNARPFRDTRALRAALVMTLDPWQGRDLPPSLWAAEDLARALGQLIGAADCQGVGVDRPDFGGTVIWR